MLKNMAQCDDVETAPHVCPDGGITFPHVQPLRMGDLERELIRVAAVSVVACVARFGHEAAVSTPNIEQRSFLTRVQASEIAKLDV